MFHIVSVFVKVVDNLVWKPGNIIVRQENINFNWSIIFVSMHIAHYVTKIIYVIRIVNNNSFLKDDTALVRSLSFSSE